MLRLLAAALALTAASSAPAARPPRPAPRGRADAPDQEARTLDRAVSRRFWEGRALAAADPRAVTLDTGSAAAIAREVALYQQWLFRRLDARGAATARVADVGCGNGDWTVPLARRAAHIFAVDLSAGFALHTGARLEREAPACAREVVCDDVAGVALPADRDLVVCGAVAQYLDDGEVEALFARVARGLAPGGLFYVRSTVSRGARRENRTAGFQGTYRPAAWYLERLDAAGFRVLDRALATTFVSDEWTHRHLRGALRPLRAPAAAVARVLRRVYRARRPTDVLVCLCASGERPGEAPAVPPSLGRGTKPA